MGSTFAKAVLTANNKTNSATEHYYMYLNISNNSFVYTQNESTPEILFTIKDESNNEITSISGLTYKTVPDASGVSITGFDITTKSGLITIFDNREITTTSSKTEEWNVTITYINYDADQSKNAGKILNANLLIQKNKIELLYHQSCNSNTLACHVAKLYSGIQWENNIYYHNGTIRNSSEFKIDSYDENGDYIEITYQAGTILDANDNSYRFAGPSDQVNNFVCFGSSASSCSENNLYRIIGVIDEKVKLIKYDYMTTEELGTDGDYIGTYDIGNATYKGNNYASIATYGWNYRATNSATHTWSISLFNNINLNTNFINYLGTEWSNKIAITTWKVGGNIYSNIGTEIPSVTYQNEIINPDAPNSTDNATEYQAKIGLMYVSDYGYAASPDAWTLTMEHYDDTTAISNNWMYMGLKELTISRLADDSFNVHDVSDIGYVESDGVYRSIAGRVFFNLESSVIYKSGSGTISDPIRIN